MKILALSGWAQPADALRIIVPQAESFDYGEHPAIEAVYRELRARQAEIVIGWSLGAQLALRATVENALRPRLLVLLAAPYQFVADASFPGGMPPEMFETFRRNYDADPQRTVQKFSGLIAKGDTKEREVLRQLQHEEEARRVEKWRGWLEELGKFSCAGIDFSSLPTTLLVQGSGDAIVRLAQYHALRGVLPRAEAQLWDDCGHAPHLHDAPRLRALVEERMRAL